MIFWKICFKQKNTTPLQCLEDAPPLHPTLDTWLLKGVTSHVSGCIVNPQPELREFGGIPLLNYLLG